MEQYIGVKRLNGKPMTLGEYNKFRGWNLPADENGLDSGYLVEYLDGGKANTEEYKGYVSWSPKDVFENSYRKCKNMTFGLAIEALKIGMKVARTGWNGKNMFVFYVPGSEVPIDELYGPAKDVAQFTGKDESDSQIICGHIDMRAADGTIVIGWLASQTDMLAEDWVIVE